MRAAVLCWCASLLLASAASGHAQRAAPRIPPLPAISPEAQAALDDLAPRFAGEAELIAGWFRDRPVEYYNFGTLRAPIVAAHVFWPIHGFDASGNPVSMRGQRPIFTTLPGLPGYSGLWRLTYVVTADHVQPNQLRDTAAMNALVRRKRAALHETPLTLNLPLVARGTRLARDTSTGMPGWFEGRDVQFFDFGQASVAAAPMWRFTRDTALTGEPTPLPGQNSLVDSVPMAPSYPDLWEIRFVRVDSAFAPNSLKSASALRVSNLVVGPPQAVRNLPIVLFDGRPVLRVQSPLTTFADIRSPFPPAPTRPQ